MARCACGALTLQVHDRPYATVICHCTACKRRTGSAIGVGVYFDVSAVTISGNATRYDRQVADRAFSSFFCPTCGTSLYWKTQLHPQGVGIALGCFDDPSAFVPDRSVWEATRLDWLHVDSIPGHIEGSKSARTR